MIHEVRHIHVLSAAKVTAVISFLMSLLFAIPTAIYGFFVVDDSISETDFSYTFLLIMPAFYLLFGYIFGLVFAFLYNLISKYIGGLKIELTND